MPEPRELEAMTIDQLQELKREIDQFIMSKFYSVPDEDFL